MEAPSSDSKHERKHSGIEIPCIYFLHGKRSVKALYKKERDLIF